MNWLEVSLSVNGEIAEAVADVLARFAPNGVATEQGVKYLNEADPGTADGPITVCAYVPADAHLEERRHEIEEAVEHLRMIQPVPPLAFKAIPDQNWMEAWKEHYRPIPIGQRLVIVPAWFDYRQDDRVAVRIDPGMAFGTGTHPSTQICLEFVESLMDAGRANGKVGTSTGIRAIDIGCGSGILSISALKLGAGAALAVDIDAEAIDNARQNARINGVGRELELAEGSVDEIRAGRFSIRVAELVMVNILAPVIIRLLESGLAELVATGGSIIFSGILEGQVSDVLKVAESRGLRLLDRRQTADWVGLLMTK